MLKDSAFLLIEKRNLFFVMAKKNARWRIYLLQFENIHHIL